MRTIHLVSSVLAGACVWTAASAQTTFIVRTLSPSAPGAAGIVAGDLDGDGDTDVVTAEYQIDTVAWYENSGASPPTWTKRVIDGGALGPITVAVGDADRDGDLDVFSANFNDEGIAWYGNDGGSPPSFTKQVISAFWVGAWGVDAADVDRDGDIDGIGGLTNTACGPPLHCVGVEWYESNGATPPHFTIRPVSPGLVGASSVRAADVDGDTDIDILSVDTANDRILWYENDGATPPGWTERVLATGPDDPWSVASADLDRDGDLDVLSASAEDDRVAWYENDGEVPPGWTTHTIATGRDGAISVYAADLDGDGDADVIAGAWWDSMIAWYESDGGAPPTFTEHPIATCGGPEGIFAARVDGDADVDVLCAANPGGKVHFYENLANFSETDGDGVRDDLDCAPADATAFAVPAEVRDVAFESTTRLAWAPEAARAGAGTVYDVLQGALPEFPVGSGQDEICLDPGAEEAARTVDVDPEPGMGLYYLVRASNTCDTGSWGVESSGTERTSTVCP